LRCLPSFKMSTLDLPHPSRIRFLLDCYSARHSRSLIFLQLWAQSCPVVALSVFTPPLKTKQTCFPIKNKKYAFHRMRRTPSITDIIIFKRCRAKARQIILEAEQSFWKKFCNSITSNLELTTAQGRIKGGRGEQRGRLPRALCSKGVPVMTFICFKWNIYIIVIQNSYKNTNSLFRCCAEYH